MLVIICLTNLINGLFALSWYNNLASNPRCIEDNQAIVEYYKMDEYEYMFFSERVPWNEAKIICPIYDAELAIVDTPTKANKLAAAIAESNIDMEDIWIGGQRSPTAENWTWVNDEMILSNTINGFPPWGQSPDKPWKQCLAMDRLRVDSPLFVDLDCHLPKPFMCQRDIDGPANPDITLPSNIVAYERRTYILYHTRITWGAAVAFCRMRGYRLAVIPNNEIAKFVSTAMLRSRPSFENVWVSGHFLHKSWEWLPTGELIHSYPDENNYPPWHHNSTNKTNGCILFDRHICAEPVFLASKCDRRRDFLCEKTEKKIEYQKKNRPVKIIYESWPMVLFLKELPWNEAQEYCQKLGGYLTEIYDYEMMRAITTAMADLASEPIHVWLGGMLVNDTWIWTHTNKSIPASTDKTGFIPWCDVEEKEDDDCLNMDREAHDKPSVYGLNCDMKQPFICTIDSKRPSSSNDKSRAQSQSNNLPIEINSPSENITTVKNTCDYPAIVLPYKSKLYVIFFNEVPYDQVVNECRQAGGKLANIKNDTIGALLNFLNAKGSNCEGMNLWITSDKNCSQLNLKKHQIDVNNCSTNQGFICETACSIPNSSDIFKQTVWDCNEGDDKEHNLECAIRCEKEMILKGSDRVTCSDEKGWGTPLFKTTYLPVCLYEAVARRTIRDQVKELQNSYHGFLFVIDESYSIVHSEWLVQLNFVSRIIEMYPLSKDFPMGLIMFSRLAYVPIPYNETDTCKALDIIHKMRIGKERDFTFYNYALEEAQNQIQKYQPTRKTIIFLISDGNNNGEDYSKVLQELRKQHLIISVGISEEPLNDLNIVASMRNDKLLMYKFPQFDTFTKFTEVVATHRSKSLKCKP